MTSEINSGTNSETNSEIKCPICASEYTYQDGSLWICSECAHEWNPSVGENKDQDLEKSTIRDANGNVLQEGDSVNVIKDLKVKGSSLVVKVGTKVRNIRLIEDADDGHNIACKVDGIGAMNLKSEFVKKS